MHDLSRDGGLDPPLRVNATPDILAGVGAYVTTGVGVHCQVQVGWVGLRPETAGERTLKGVGSGMGGLGVAGSCSGCCLERLLRKGWVGGALLWGWGPTRE